MESAVQLERAGIDVRPGARVPEAAAPGELVRERAETGKTVGNIAVDDPIFSCRDVDVFYGEKHAIRKVSIDIAKNQVLAMIGPSGCGKSTFLRCLNRMNDTIAGARVEGEDMHGAAGSSAGTAGDTDGDGYDDLVLGAPDDDEGGSSAGAAYLLLGGGF